MTNREPETAVSARVQKIKSIKNEQLFIFYFLFFLSLFCISLNLKLVTHLSIISMVILHT